MVVLFIIIAPILPRTQAIFSDTTCQVTCFQIILFSLGSQTSNVDGFKTKWKLRNEVDTCLQLVDQKSTFLCQ